MLAVGLTAVGLTAVALTTPLRVASASPYRPRISPLRLAEQTSAEPTTTAAEPADTSRWLALWFPVCFSAAVEERMVSATIFERPIVLFRDEVGKLQCLHDQCPHRLAPLSDGRLTSDPETGKARLECSYHGWQFSGCGRCTLLPQLDGDKPILTLYDASSYAVTEKQGIVYVFLGDKKDASSVPVPAVPELDEEDWIYEQDYMRDLPYDYTTLVENIIDPSHVPVSHHGTVQGDRSLAQPLETNLKRAPSVLHGDGGAATPPLPLAFSGETEVPLHASSRLSFTQQTVKQSVTFTAPSLLSYKFSVAAGDACALFYPIPTFRGKSRILVRRGRNFATGRTMRRVDVVAKHLENNIVFDQDMAFLRGQEARLQAMRPDGWGGAWRAGSSSPGYVMPAQADRFVISFRKQLASVADALPWLSPPDAQAAHAAPLPRRLLLDRYEQHTKHCAVCSEALALTERWIRISQLVSQAALMAALVSLASAAVPPWRFGAMCALSAAAYSIGLLRTYVVGPVLGAMSNRKATTPLVAAAAYVAAALTGRSAPMLHACSFLLPATTAVFGAYAAHALDGLRARFVYTEEAKALQDS